MSRYRGPRFKKIRRLGALPGLTSKKPRAGSDLRNQLRPGKKSQYRIRLEEKQKLRFHYGLTEEQLLKYVRIAGKAKGSTGQVLLQLLEMRLDNILFRLGMASTIPQARQLVNHRHILVNNRMVDIPSYRCKPRDIITVRDEQKKSKSLVQNYLDSSIREELPKHLTLNPFQYQGSVNQIIDSKWEEPYEMKISCTVLKRRFIESNDDRNGCRLNPKKIMQKLYRIIMKLCD
ncbi:hypothetical protein CsatB_000980 [Cannabis sativa]